MVFDVEGLGFSLQLEDLDVKGNYSGLWCLKEDYQMLVDIGFARYLARCVVCKIIRCYNWIAIYRV